MSGLTYPQLLSELFPRLTGGIRWGLERTRRMLAAVGDPHLAFDTLHIGGTNGKGSVAALCASALRASGRRVGLYTSPHLCAFRERVRVDGVPVSEDALIAAAERLWPQVRAEEPSFFEATTALAFLALADARVDVGVIEVGLGGRLDATNVVEPRVTVVTNVALDHVQFLGNALAEVAFEKAGIFRPGVPAVTGETGAEALAVLRDRAREVGAPLREVSAASELRAATSTLEGGRFTADTIWGELDVSIPLAGMHQHENALVALRALELLPAALRPGPAAVLAGFAHTKWDGRLQVEQHAGRTWIFDVAHNVAGVQALVAALETLQPPRPLAAVVGVLGDKDWRGMLGPLHRLADAVVLTEPPTAPAERRWDPHAALAEAGVSHARVEPDFGAALALAHGAAAPGGTVLVTGSFHTVGDALIVLGMSPHGADATLPHVEFGR